MIADIPELQRTMYVSSPVPAISPKLAKDTVYMPSAVAARTLGVQGTSPVSAESPAAPAPGRWLPAR